MVIKQNVEASKEQSSARNAPKQTVDKYEQAIKKYSTNPNDDEVREAVKSLIEEKAHTNGTPEVEKFLFGSIELTSLRCIDPGESIMTFTEKVDQSDTQYADPPHVVIIRVYPCFVQVVCNTLEIEGVEIACVSGGLPSSQAPIEVKVAGIALVVKDGATEIDIVILVDKLLSGNYGEMCEDIQELKETCGDAAMKVILETGCLKIASSIKGASILSMYAGADYVKTSTDKEKVTATPETVYVMCQAIREYYDETSIQINFKSVGGINSVVDALIYYTIVKEVLGKKWLTSKRFRLGTSHLANMLLGEIEGREVKFL